MLTREQAKSIQSALMGRPVDYLATPLESGMGGCPWRVMVCHLLVRGLSAVKRSVASEDVARKVFKDLYGKWAVPEAIAKAKRYDVVDVIQGVNFPHARGRAIHEFCRAWIKDDWKTTLDLPYVGMEASIVLDRYVTFPQEVMGNG